MTTKKKRVLSPAQKAALAKGRAALAKKKKSGVRKASKKAVRAKVNTLTKEINTIRKRRRVAKKSGQKRFHLTSIDTDMKPLLLSEGTMKTRKTSKRKTTRRKSTARRYGTELPLGSKRRTRRKSTRRYSGFKAGKIDIVKPLINSGVAVAGGIAGSFIANKIPVQDARIKAALPLALGLVLDITKFGRKNAMVQAAAAGMMVVGGLALVRQLFPTVPLLAGEEEVSMIDTSDIDPTLLGAPVDLMGEELELSADADDYVSAADL